MDKLLTPNAGWAQPCLWLWGLSRTAAQVHFQAFCKPISLFWLRTWGWTAWNCSYLCYHTLWAQYWAPQFELSLFLCSRDVPGARAFSSHPWDGNPEQYGVIQVAFPSLLSSENTMCLVAMALWNGSSCSTSWQWTKVRCRESLHPLLGLAEDAAEVGEPQHFKAKLKAKLQHFLCLWGRAPVKSPSFGSHQKGSGFLCVEKFRFHIYTNYIFLMIVLLKEQYSVPSAEGNMHQKWALHFFVVLLLLRSNQLQQNFFPLLMRERGARSSFIWNPVNSAEYFHGIIGWPSLEETFERSSGPNLILCPLRLQSTKSD